MDINAWSVICEKYFKVKTLYIEGEEYDPKLKSNLQPLNELRNALDHVFRIVALELKREIDGDNPDLKLQLEKQFYELDRHLTLVFYDVCDYLSLAYRNRINDILKPYSSSVIRNAFPNYYREMRPKIEEINGKFALLRGKRSELGSEGDDDEVFYQHLLELQKYYQTIYQGIHILEDFNRDEEKQIAEREKDRKETRFLGIGGWILTIVLTILGIIIGYLLK